MLNNELFDSCFPQINSTNGNSNAQSNDLLLSNNHQLQYKRAITGTSLKEKSNFLPNYPSSFHPISINNQFKQSNNHALHFYSNTLNSFCKYSRKVFIGGLPPDIGESIKFVLFQSYFKLRFEYIFFKTRFSCNLVTLESWSSIGHINQTQHHHFLQKATRFSYSKRNQVFKT
jgi:hypothetical protein